MITFTLVIAGLVPATQASPRSETWVAGINPAMTTRYGFLPIAGPMQDRNKMQY
jgi:hypothetical protein